MSFRNYKKQSMFFDVVDLSNSFKWFFFWQSASQNAEAVQHVKCLVAVLQANIIQT